MQKILPTVKLFFTKNILAINKIYKQMQSGYLTIARSFYRSFISIWQRMAMPEQQLCGLPTGQSQSAVSIIRGADRHFIGEEMSIRLKLEDSQEGLVATISERNEAGKIIGRPSVFLVGTKEERRHGREHLFETWA